MAGQPHQASPAAPMGKDKKKKRVFGYWRFPNLIVLAAGGVMIWATFQPVAIIDGTTFIPWDVVANPAFDREFEHADRWKSVLRYEILLVPVIAAMMILFELAAFRRGKDSVALKICAAMSVPLAGVLVLTYFGIHPASLRPEHTEFVLDAGWWMLGASGAALVGAFLSPKPRERT